MSRLPFILLPSLCVGLLFLSSSAATVAPEDEDAKLTAYFRAFLDEDFRACPLNATNLGDHRFDNQLDDISPKARAGWSARYRRTQKSIGQHPIDVSETKLRCQARSGRRGR